MLDAKVISRFWSKVDRSGECWIWTAFRIPFGYGRLTISGKVVAAHRVSWEISFGPIPDGKHVLHRCDNPPCVRPSHLFIGTNADNVADMMTKGRQRNVRGSEAGMAKLNEAKVAALKSEYTAGATIPQLAAAYDVSAGLIGQVIAGRIWKHVGGSVRKGPAAGERTNKNRVSEAQVLEIRQRYRPGMRMQDLADEYGVSLTAIYHIVHRNTWRHIP